jgi:hypothetical protein
LRKNPGVACGVAAAKRCPSVSASGMGHPALSGLHTVSRAVVEEGCVRRGGDVAGAAGLPDNER